MNYLNQEIAEKASETQFLKTIYENQSVFIVKINTEGNYTFVNEYYYKFFDWQNENLVGTNSSLGIVPEDRGKLQIVANECLSQPNKKVKVELTKEINGIRSTALWEFVGLPNAQNQTEEILCIGFDITEQKKAELALRKTQDLLLQTSKMARVGGFEKNFITGTDDWTAITKEIHEVSPDFADMANGILFYKEGESRTKIIEVVSKAMRENTSFEEELQIITAKGNERWVRVIGHTEFGDGVCIRLYGTFQDIHEAKLKSIALEKAQNEAATISNYYKDLVENQSVYIIKTDLEGNYTYVNNHFASKFGFPDIIGTSSMLSIIEEDWAKCIEVVKKCIATPEVTHTVILRKLLQRGGTINNFWEFKGIRNVAGELSEILCIGFDVTKMFEIQDELKRSLQRVESQNSRLQNFSHIVSHNLRSHSGNISEFISLLIEEYEELTDNAYFKYLKIASDNLMDAINHLSEVAQLRTNEPTSLVPLNLYQAIEKAVGNVVALAKKANLNIISELQGDETVMGETVYLDSIILNFLTNAIKYRSEDRDSYVRLTCFAENNFLILKIEDNGIGIDLAKNGHKLFGMFKTFHKHPDARGVGLFITKNQIETLGGKVEVESEVGKGTTFKIYFQK